MGLYRNKDGHYYVSFMYRGNKGFKRLAHGISKADARSAEIEFTAEFKRSIDAEAKHVEKRKAGAGNPTLIELLNFYENQHLATLRSPESALFALNRLRKYEVLPDPVTGEWYPKASDCPAIVERFIAENRQLKPATINRTIGVLKKALSHFYKIGYLNDDVGRRITRLPENNQRDSYMTEEQALKIAAHASPKVAAGILIAFYSGMRRGEVLKLVPSSISDTVITIEASNTKNLRSRRIPITTKLRPLLAQIPIGLTADGFATGFDRARKKAGLPKVRMHDARHGAASAMVQAGVDLHTVARVLGHSQMSTTMRYAKLQTDNLREALEKI